jgi:hypothetical protein
VPLSLAQGASAFPRKQRLRDKRAHLAVDAHSKARLMPLHQAGAKSADSGKVSGRVDRNLVESRSQLLACPSRILYLAARFTASLR